MTMTIITVITMLVPLVIHIIITALPPFLFLQPLTSRKIDELHAVGVTGMIGGGKTLLSVFLALREIAKKRRKYIGANFKLLLETSLTSQEDTVFIMDEAGKHLSNKDDPLTNLRKQNNFLIMPSAYPLPPTISRRCAILKYAGHAYLFAWPIAKYEVLIEGKSSGSAWAFNMYKVFGTYDTNYIPSNIQSAALKARIINE